LIQGGLGRQNTVLGQCKHSLAETWLSGVIRKQGANIRASEAATDFIVIGVPPWTSQVRRPFIFGVKQALEHEQWEPLAASHR
jgi:hypothetical protein